MLCMGNPDAYEYYPGSGIHLWLPYGSYRSGSCYSYRAMCFSSNEYLLFLPLRKEFVEDKIETFYSEWNNPTGDNLTCFIAYNF